jgi:hypothetical protein
LTKQARLYQIIRGRYWHNKKYLYASRNCYSKLNKNCARAPSPLRGEGWGEGANGEKTQEPIMSMYNQVAINASHVIARMGKFNVALELEPCAPTRQSKKNFLDLPLTKPDIVWLLALNGIQAKVRFCLGMPSLAIRLVSFCSAECRPVNRASHNDM